MQEERRKNRFLIISHDDHEDETFKDFVLADNKEIAEEKLIDHRMLVTVIDILSVEELKELAKNLEETSDASMERKLKELKEREEQN